MKKIRMEFIVLAGLALVLVLYLVFNNASKRMNYNLPDVGKVKQEEVTKVTLQSEGQGLITLSKNGDTWQIIPQEYQVDETSLKEILTNVTDLQLTELISTSEFYTNYELDDKTRVKVTAFNGEKVVREFDVGKQATTYNHSFVKLKDNKNVYHAKGNLKLTFNKKTNELRDKKVVKYDKNTVKKVVIALQNQQKKVQPIELIKTELAKNIEDQSKDPAASQQPTTSAAPEQPQIEWKTPSGLTQDKAAIDQILDNTFELVCKEFAPENEDISKPLFSLNITADKPYELKVFAPKEDGSYPAMASTSKYIFLLNSWTGNTLKESVEKLTGVTLDTTKK